MGLMVVWREVFPGHSGEVTGDVALSVLEHRYVWPQDSVWVRANMVSSIDGAIAGVDGLSGSLNNEADGEVFAALRGLCDVVVVAGGTVRTEGYEGIEVPAQWCGVRSRLGLPEHIQLVVVSGSGRLPDAVLSPGVGVPPLVATTVVGARRLAGRIDERQLMVCAGERVDVSWVVDQLVVRGIGRVLMEGGPSLLAQAFAAGVVDELALTTVGVLSPGAHRTITDDGSDGGVHPLVGAQLVHQLVATDPMTVAALWRVIRER